MTTYHLVPLERSHAEEVITWCYPAPYGRYDLTDETPEGLLDPVIGFHAVLDGSEGLVAVRSYGADGQVPGWEYDDTALDTGGALRPQLIGRRRGIGRAVIAAGLAFGKACFDPPAFRVTVSARNARALATVRSLGFESIGTFTATHDHTAYDVLILSADRVTRVGGE